MYHYNITATRYLITFLGFVIGFSSIVKSQNYTSYFTGSRNDITTLPSGGVCLMGGASEDDHAMAWFLTQANGGDVLVLRASGSDGYNNYMYSQLGVNVNSVETIVFHSAAASEEDYVHQKIQQAEAIWFAGGDQWNYISYWRNTAIGVLINEAITNRNIVIGGTSAGMAIQGGFYFTAEKGTVNSSETLSNPFNDRITVDSLPFLSNKYLSDVITDTHYDDPDRKGRHITFLARILVDYGIAAKGIACDEYTAVCIDTNGMAKVYGGYPNHDDNAYFIQTNCELSNITPEELSINTPLNWNLGNEAIKVYSVKGTPNGSNTFDLNDWKSGTGGFWENWFVENGVLREKSSLQPNCNTATTVRIEEAPSFQLYPNPSIDYVVVKFDFTKSKPKSLRIINSIGKSIDIIEITSYNEVHIPTMNMVPGFYFIELSYEDSSKFLKKFIIN